MPGQAHSSDASTRSSFHAHWTLPALCATLPPSHLGIFIASLPVCFFAASSHLLHLHLHLHHLVLPSIPHRSSFPSFPSFTFTTRLSPISHIFSHLPSHTPRVTLLLSFPPCQGHLAHIPSSFRSSFLSTSSPASLVRSFPTLRPRYSTPALAPAPWTPSPSKACRGLPSLLQRRLLFLVHTPPLPRSLQQCPPPTPAQPPRLHLHRTPDTHTTSTLTAASSIILTTPTHMLARLWQPWHISPLPRHPLYPSPMTIRDLPPLDLDRPRLRSFHQAHHHLLTIITTFRVPAGTPPIHPGSGNTHRILKTLITPKCPNVPPPQDLLDSPLR